MARIILTDPATGRKVRYGAYDVSHCLRFTDLLPDGQDYSGLELAAPGDICRQHHVGSRAVLTRQVVGHFLGLLVDELIASGDTYQLPLRRKAQLRIVGKSKQAVRSIARRNKYPMVDLEKSQGMIYELRYEFTRRGRPESRVVRIDRRRYLQLCAGVNEGKVYAKA